MIVGGEEMKITIKSEFPELRAKKGYSITGLAKEMAVNPSVVFRMEQGKAIRPATAHKACRVLTEDFDTLFSIEDK